MKKVVKTTYACGICNHEYDKPEGALECEKSGTAIPEFKQFEVIELVGIKPGELIQTVSGHKIPFRPGMKAVIHDNAKGGWPDPHLLPKAYEVWVLKVSQSHKDKRELISGVEREYLKRAGTKRGLICPLCESATFPVQERSYDYFQFGSGLPLLENISARECKECDAKFFTDSQSLGVETTIRKRIKWPIANTEKLVREYQFE